MKPNLAFLWSASPIPLESRNTANLLAIYKEGASDFVSGAVEKCYRDILNTVYLGRVAEELEIVLDSWDVRVMSEVVRRVQNCFPSLEITWILAKQVVLVKFTALQETIQKDSCLFCKDTSATIGPVVTIGSGNLHSSILGVF